MAIDKLLEESGRGAAAETSPGERKKKDFVTKGAEGGKKEKSKTRVSLGQPLTQ